MLFFGEGFVMMKDDEKPQGQLVVQIVAMPKDTNANGDIFGGWLVSHMDMGGAIAARHKARCVVVTVAIDTMTFLKPVNVGDVVCCYALLLKVGRTSMQFQVEVWTISADVETQKKVAVGNFTFVAVDDNGKPQLVNR